MRGPLTRFGSGRTWLTLAAVVAAAGLTAAAGAPDGPPPVAFVDVSVIPMDADRVVAHQTVLTRDGRIEWIGDAAAAAIAPDATRVDGNGRFLLPGLADLHVHLEEADLARVLANGVTTAREMGATGRHLDWREEVTAGARLGPRLVVCTPPLTSTDDWPVRHTVITSPGQATQFLFAFAQHGFDCAQIYDGLSADVYSAIVKTARLAGMSVAGRIPESVGLDGVLAAGQWLEHAGTIVNAAAGHDPDPAAMPAAADAVKAAGVAVTPTLAAARATPHSETQRALVKALAARGVPLVAGTDAPNAQLAPGSSIHEELAALADAGLSRYEVLRAATAGAADALGATGRFGVVRAGAAADLILADANPLADLAALRRPAGVMAGGRWLDRARLDGLLKEAAAAAAREKK